MSYRPGSIVVYQGINYKIVSVERQGSEKVYGLTPLAKNTPGKSVITVPESMLLPRINDSYNIPNGVGNLNS